MPLNAVFDGRFRGREKCEMFLALVGVGYGLVLAVLSIACAGVGHGTYIPAAVSSAPLGAIAVLASLLGASPTGSLTSAAPALLGAPIVWGCMGRLVDRASNPSGRTWFLVAAISHYATSVVLMFTERFGGWAYVTRLNQATPWILPTWLAIYLGGQAWMWARFGRTI